ncbi:MAG: hypothetical protein WCJ93_11715 [Methanomicrobiales archaeon]
MNKKVSIGVIIIAMVIVIAVSGSAMAARPVPAGNETSQIIVRTSAKVVGSFIAETDLALQQSTGDLSPPLTDGEQIGLAVYSENTIGINGETNYIKDTHINTGDVVNGQENVQTDRIITFEGGDGGRMVSSENVIVSTVGTETTSTAGCCPWGSTTNTTLPAECETVQAGSTMDVYEVSASSSSGVRVISDTPGTTVSLDYRIDARGINQTQGSTENAAIGSATAYVDGKILASTGNGTAVGTDMEYHDVTSVDGLFDLSKDVSYSSAPN